MSVDVGLFQISWQLGQARPVKNKLWAIAPSDLLRIIYKEYHMWKESSKVYMAEQHFSVKLAHGTSCLRCQFLLYVAIPLHHRNFRTCVFNRVVSRLYVEQPVGTGYSEGAVQAHNETDISRDLFGFFQEWLKVFQFWMSQYRSSLDVWFISLIWTGLPRNEGEKLLS